VTACPRVIKRDFLFSVYKPSRTSKGVNTGTVFSPAFNSHEEIRSLVRVLVVHLQWSCCHDSQEVMKIIVVFQGENCSELVVIVMVCADGRLGIDFPFFWVLKSSCSQSNCRTIA
jgi:hypothetical protein